MVRRWWLGLLAAGLAACGAEPGENALELLDFRQSELGSVGLNEELLFFFSEDLERGSVTSASVQIVGPRGRVVAGKRIVRGNALSFVPELPCASDLSDGGLRPGESYRVILGGFPRPDGIRSESGAVLSASLRLSFRTAEPDGTSPLFLDPFTGPYPLIPRGRPLRSGELELEDGLLVLECAEALDPSSVPGARFELSHIPPGASEPEVIPLVARLIVNLRDHGELVLEPGGDGLAGRRLAPDRYALEMVGRGLRTLGGRAVEPGWQSLLLNVPEVRVEIDLAEKRVRPSEQPPGCQGTALWRDASGSDARRGLHVRYPAAAGDGSAGTFELREVPPGRDLHATRISVPAGTHVDLSAVSGPVVLRSQTVLEVSGRLTRTGAGPKPDNPLTRAFERAAQLGEEHWEPLSAWVERLLAPTETDPWSGEPWTVLIAGGDIRVPAGGAIEVEGPLVLVAGGWIRVGGKLFSQGDVWKTPEGGGVTSRARVERLPLVLDPPAQNPLRAALIVGALTKPFPWTPRNNAWRLEFAGRAGSARLGARFVRGIDARGELHADPRELGPGPVRALLLFELGPGNGEPWESPWLERLSLEAVPGQLPVGPRR